MNRDVIHQLLNGRGITVSEEHLAMLEAQMGVIQSMRAALDGAPSADKDIGLIHALEEERHD